ncbi:MBL fold metallo-hydrolase [Candidatus Pacearchaeota archaeon]|nr:MBL fold metallo-hydrolase [Candidatus Pacearchaeota archaeon]
MEIGNIKIDFLGHSGFLVTIVNGVNKKIFIDPYNLSENAVKEKADIILITHSHYDHCSIKDIERIKKEKTKIICPADVQSKITRIENVDMQVMEQGGEIEFGNIRIQAMPAYNINKDFHTKKDHFLGYLIKISEIILYHSGDSDKIPEMEKLTGYSKQGNKLIVMLPVSGIYVMDANEAAETAKMIGADTAIPMHYGAGVAGTIEDAKKFVEVCQQLGIKAVILEKI